MELFRTCAPCFIHHFTQYSDDGFVGCLSLSTSLGVLWTRLVLLDLVGVQKSSHMTIYKGSSIVGQHYFWYAKPTDYAFL